MSAVKDTFPLGAHTMNAEDALKAYKTLVTTIVDAYSAALKAGMTREDIAAILAKHAEILENAED
jgi:hypothetical protein